MEPAGVATIARIPLDLTHVAVVVGIVSAVMDTPALVNPLQLDHKKNVMPFAVYTDVDECAENRDNCTQNCTNTVGSFSCFCGLGFVLSHDRRTCQGIHTYIYF